MEIIYAHKISLHPLLVAVNNALGLLHVAGNNKNTEVFMRSVRYFCLTLNKIFNFSTHFSKSCPVTIFLKIIRPLEAHLIHEDRKTEKERDRQTDRHNEANRPFSRLFANALKTKETSITHILYYFRRISTKMFKNTLVFLITQRMSLVHFLSRSGDSTYM
jgi:hypothetical protein